MDIQTRFLENLASKDKRIDERKLDEFRKISIETGIMNNAEGSARVKIGETEVLAGVKMGVGTPFSDRPDEGILMVGSEFSPLASPMFEIGPPSENAIELARVVDRGIRESKAIEVEKLVIESKEKVWIVNVDIHLINHQGNLIDASGIAAIAALLDTKIPEYDGEKIILERMKEKLPVKYKPIPVTFGKLGTKLLVDTNMDEELGISARLTVTTKDDGNICSIQKGGSGLSLEDINKAFETSVKIGSEIRKMI